MTLKASKYYIHSEINMEQTRVDKSMIELKRQTDKNKEDIGKTADAMNSTFEKLHEENQNLINK